MRFRQRMEQLTRHINLFLAIYVTGIGNQKTDKKASHSVSYKITIPRLAMINALRFDNLLRTS
jgi:hypothetical protein